MVRKEFIQMRRDRLTFGMMIGVPMIQLILFGYAINSNPKHLPTAVFSADNSVFARSIVWGMRNSSYFDITREPRNEAEINTLLAENAVQFAVTIPVDFSRKLLRGEKPDLLLEADATDPDGGGLRDCGDEFADTDNFEPRFEGSAGEIKRRGRAVQFGCPAALQPGKHHAI